MFLDAFEEFKSATKDGLGGSRCRLQILQGKPTQVATLVRDQQLAAQWKAYDRSDLRALFRYQKEAVIAMANRKRKYGEAVRDDSNADNVQNPKKVKEAKARGNQSGTSGHGRGGVAKRRGKKR